MFDNIDEKIKSLGKFLFVLSIIVGIIWLFISCGINTSIIIPIAVSVSSCISSILIYGFGVIISCLMSINEKLGANFKDDNDKLSAKVTDNSDEIRNRVNKMYKAISDSRK